MFLCYEKILRVVARVLVLAGINQAGTPTH